ncbi:hypothetical protein G7Z17_g11702 [Cylindrodendrum hubeiense]|uniref:Uncharacterized protein n=1 Tax=Cylindrodendrum hubeiense TaxID=595255 RepID=A0A9P5LBD3_9HYPO|nr:hypothetical protein G7Z17_g11702 [Cylindrodendrum hubeiense]
MSVNPDDQEYWKTNIGFLFEGLTEVIDLFTLEQLETYLAETEDWLRENILPQFVDAFESLNTKLERRAARPEKNSNLQNLFELGEFPP